MPTPIIVADFRTQLATPIQPGDTEFDILSATDDDGNPVPPGICYLTLTGGTKEYLRGTLAGTTLTSVYHVSRQGVETTGALYEHRIGEAVTVTDFATYKAYMDGVALQGAPDASVGTSGVTRLSVAPVSPTSPISIGNNDPRIAPNNYGASSAGTDTYAITLSSAPAAYAAGQQYTFKADVANTGPATLNVNGLGAKTIKKDGTTDLDTNDILAGQIMLVEYDGTYMQLLSAPSTESLYPFGDGTDGNVTVAGTTTLTRDMYYNNLTVTGTLNTAGWRIFVKGTFAGTGTVAFNGANGTTATTQSGGAGGAAVLGGFFENVPGGNGSNGASSGFLSLSSAGGINTSNSLGVNGARGGYGGGQASDISGGAGVSGIAGVRTLVVQKFGVIKWLTLMGLDALLNGTTTKLKTSAGSSGGTGGLGRNNSGNGNGGGGGGAGATGGIIAIFARNYTGTVTVSARGGNGGAGANNVQPNGGAGGGGAGGSGGAIYIVYLTNTSTGTLTVTGGTGGAAGVMSGAGTQPQAGAAGNTGTTALIRISSLT